MKDKKEIPKITNDTIKTHKVVKTKEDYNDGYPHDIMWNPGNGSINELIKDLCFENGVSFEIKFILRENNKSGNLIYRLILQ